MNNRQKRVLGRIKDGWDAFQFFVLDGLSGGRASALILEAQRELQRQVDLESRAKEARCRVRW